MKKIMLTAMVLAIVFTLQAQQDSKKAFPLELPEDPRAMIPLKKEALTETWQREASRTYNINGRELTFINIGQTPNGFSFQNRPGTTLWADEYINSVVYTYPSESPESQIAYALSMNKGIAGSWGDEINVYNDTTKPGVFPQGGIINPFWNTNPDSAIFTYFSAMQDGSNGTYGGYAFGVNPMSQINPPSPTANHQTSSGNYYRGIPEAFTITSEGKVFVVDPCFPADQNYEYNGNLILEKGIYNESTGDIEYEQGLFPALMPGDGINDSKIAFDPSGQYGYILLMSDANLSSSDYTQFHPVLYQSTDGGESWEVNPIHSQLGGPGGMYEVKQFVEDDLLESLFGSDFHRDSIQYSMGYHADMVVDVTGNVHITGIIAPADDTAWYPLQDLMGTFHVWYDHGTDTWDAHLLNMNRTFMGENEGLTMYNNPGLSINTQGDVLFFTWNDTEMDGLEENIAPDIYMMVCDIWGPFYGELDNITQFTQAMWTSHFATPSYYVFDRCPNGNWIFTIPLVYLETIYEPSYPAKIWYIDGVEVWNWAYCNNVEEENASNLSKISFKPNPFNIQTSLELQTMQPANIRLEVFNTLGQKILETDHGKKDAGRHEFIIRSEELRKGVYFCKIHSDGESVTKKMIVE